MPRPAAVPPPPECPSANDVADDLRALGLDPAAIARALEAPRDRVYRSLVKGWRELHAMPRIRVIAEECGIADSTVSKIFDELLRAGRVRKVRDGVWVPRG